MTAETPAPAADHAEPLDSRDPRAPFAAVRAEVGKAVVGQDSVITGLLIALLCQGHVLLEGVPGVAHWKAPLLLNFSMRLLPASANPVGAGTTFDPRVPAARSAWTMPIPVSNWRLTWPSTVTPGRSDSR